MRIRVWLLPRLHSLLLAAAPGDGSATGTCDTNSRDDVRVAGIAQCDCSGWWSRLAVVMGFIGVRGFFVGEWVGYAIHGHYRRWRKRNYGRPVLATAVYILLLSEDGRRVGRRPGVLPSRGGDTPGSGCSGMQHLCDASRGCRHVSDVATDQGTRLRRGQR